MLSFEYDAKSGVLEIFFDTEGKDQLLRSIEGIVKPGDHDHLMTPAWSGHELSGEIHGGSSTLINMVTLGMPRKQDE